MKECITYKLKDICLKITDGSHFSPIAREDGYPMFSVKDMEEYGFNYDSCKRISIEDFNTLKANDCVPQKGDILVAKDGSFLKQIFVCTETREEAILSSIAIFRPNPEYVIPEFLCYILKSPKVYNYIAQNCVSGSALPRIVLKAFKEVEVSIPSTDVQKWIISKLTPIDQKIQLNRQINDNLEQQAQNIFNHYFIDNPIELGSCSEGVLTDIAVYLNGLAMQKFRPEGSDFGLPVLKIKELGQRSCDNNSDSCSSLIKEEYIVNDGDVIFSWSGTLLVDLWCGGKCGLNQHLFKVTSDTYPKWFYYFWTKHHLDNFIRVAKDKAVTMGHIKRTELEKANIIIPTQDKLSEINKIMSPIITKIIKHRVEMRKLAQLRDSLLPQLMSGDLKINELNC